MALRRQWNDDDLRLIFLRALRHQIGPFVLLGAHARDVVCNEIAGLAREMPSTSDLDVAVAVPLSGGSFRTAREKLDGTGTGSDLRFYLPEGAGVPNRQGMPIDVLPYGAGVEDIEHIRVGRDRFLDVSGVEEAASVAFSVQVHPTLDLWVPPLDALIGLKLLAYGLRSQFHECKDARDLDLLLDAASVSDAAEQDYYAHADVVPEEADYDVALAGPWLMGRRLAQLFPPPLMVRALGCIDRQLVPRMLVHGYRNRVGTADADLRRQQMEFFRKGAQSQGHVSPWPPQP